MDAGQDERVKIIRAFETVALLLFQIQGEFILFCIKILVY